MSLRTASEPDEKPPSLADTARGQGYDTIDHGTDNSPVPKGGMKNGRYVGFHNGKTPETLEAEGVSKQQLHAQLVTEARKNGVLDPQFNEGNQLVAGVSARDGQTMLADEKGEMQGDGHPNPARLQKLKEASSPATRTADADIARTPGADMDDWRAVFPKPPTSSVPTQPPQAPVPIVAAGAGAGNTGLPHDVAVLRDQDQRAAATRATSFPVPLSPTAQIYASDGNFNTSQATADWMQGKINADQLAEVHGAAATVARGVQARPSEAARAMVGGSMTPQQQRQLSQEAQAASGAAYDRTHPGETQARSYGKTYQSDALSIGPGGQTINGQFASEGSSVTFDAKGKPIIAPPTSAPTRPPAVPTTGGGSIAREGVPQVNNGLPTNKDPQGSFVAAPSATTGVPTTPTRGTSNPAFSPTARGAMTAANGGAPLVPTTDAPTGTSNLAFSPLARSAMTAAGGGAPLVPLPPASPAANSAADSLATMAAGGTGAARQLLTSQAARPDADGVTRQPVVNPATRGDAATGAPPTASNVTGVKPAAPWYDDPALAANRPAAVAGSAVAPAIPTPEQVQGQVGNAVVALTGGIVSHPWPTVPGASPMGTPAAQPTPAPAVASSTPPLATPASAPTPSTAPEMATAAKPLVAATPAPAATPTIQPTPSLALAAANTSPAAPSGVPAPVSSTSRILDKAPGYGADTGTYSAAAATSTPGAAPNAVYDPDKNAGGNATFKPTSQPTGNAVYDPNAASSGNAVSKPTDQPTGNAVYQPTSHPAGNAAYDADAASKGNAVYKPDPSADPSTRYAANAPATTPQIPIPTVKPATDDDELKKAQLA